MSLKNKIAGSTTGVAPSSQVGGAAERQSLIELRRVNAEQAILIKNLTALIAMRDGAIEEIYLSNSWRITKPFRQVAQLTRFSARIIPLSAHAIRYGGGLKNTLLKAWRIYRREGVDGIKRAFRSASAAVQPILPKDLHPVFESNVTTSYNKSLAPRVLLIAEMSIPQCKKYRVEQKQEMLRALGFECSVLSWTDNVVCMQAIQTHSVVIFYRVPAFEGVQNLIRECLRLGLKMFWEVDDLIFDREILEKSKTLASLDKEVLDGLLNGAALYHDAMIRCGSGIASTPGLALAMKKAGLQEVLIIENALDKQTLETAERVRKNNTDHNTNIVRIVYGSGTSTHNIDFEEAAPAIAKTLSEFPDVRLKIIGLLDLPAGLFENSSQIERIPGCNYEEYLEHLSGCDISIAPLENYIFNDSKSNIKYLEASILKLPSVCSPRSAFSQVINSGENGFLCESSNDWYEALAVLVSDSELRKKIGEAAYRTAIDCYSPSAIARNQVSKILQEFTGNPEKTRILSVNCYYAPRSFGGATIVAEELNDRLQNGGDFDVHVLTTHAESTTFAYNIRRYCVDGINIYGVGVPGRVEPLTQFDNPDFTRAFEEVIAAVNPDVVHLHSIQGMGVGIIDVCIMRNIKYVITLHDAWWVCGRQFLINKEEKYCGQVKINPSICARCVDDAQLNDYRNDRLAQALYGAAALLAPSQYFANFYVGNGFPSVVVNKNGIVPPRALSRIKSSDKLRFAYVGGNTKIKGVHLIKNAFSGLHGNVAELVVVDNALNLGFSSYTNEELKSISSVQIVPAYNQFNIDEFFASIDVLLLPTQCIESFGLAAREASARNVWVIATDSGGLVEDIEDGGNGIIIPLNDDGTQLRRAILDTIDFYKKIPTGASINLTHKNAITTFDEQAQELSQILKSIRPEHTPNDSEPLYGYAKQTNEKSPRQFKIEVLD